MEPRVAVLHRGAYLQCSTWLIAVGSHGIVIDPGSGVAMPEVRHALELQGLQLTRISTVLLTHCHIDHAFGVTAFQNAGAVIVASPYTAHVLAQGSEEIWYEHPELLHPIDVDRTVGDGDVIGSGDIRLRCLATPGHTPGSMSYVLPTAAGTVVFSGDLLMPDGAPGWAGSSGFSGESSIVSLRRLQKLSPQRVLTGHGEVPGDIDAWLSTAITTGANGEWELKSEPQATAVPTALARRRRPDD